MKQVVIFFIALVLAGCQSHKSNQPLLDTGMIRTEAVRTAIAEITVQAILNPATPMATLTSSPRPKDFEVETANPMGTLTLTPMTIGKDSTATPFEPVYACSIDLSASLPRDGPQPVGKKIEKTWVIRNSGNVTWTSENVRIRWVGGVNLCDQDCLDWSGKVEPGDKHSIKINLTMPDQPINKLQIVEWGLVNQENEIFCKLYYLIPYVY